MGNLQNKKNCSIVKKNSLLGHALLTMFGKLKEKAPFRGKVLLERDREKFLKSFLFLWINRLFLQILTKI